MNNAKYQPVVPLGGVNEEQHSKPKVSLWSFNETLNNFVLLSVLLSANHGCVVSCMALATARLGSVGAWQSGMLYVSYTGSSLLGATYIVKKLGARDALQLGMTLYCIYVGCFVLATNYYNNHETIIAIIGAIFGGMGAGLFWTGQGTYFALSAQAHAEHFSQPKTVSTSLFAAIFAFCYLAEEVVLRLLSTFLLHQQNMLLSWNTIFALYTLIAVASTLIMPMVKKYPTNHLDEQDDQSNNGDNSSNNNLSAFHKTTVAWQLLRNDPKMKYMIGMNAVFGFSWAFINSYVNGEVVRLALHDSASEYVGALTAWASCVAAVMSLIFGTIISNRVGNGPILIFGAVCCIVTTAPFLLYPNIANTTYWNWNSLLFVYTVNGMGRATFEGAFKAVFVDFFPQDKEGAFANIILQHGLSGAIGYVLTFSLLCTEQSTYCIEYYDKSLHNVLLFECLIVLTAIFAILGYWRASVLHHYKNDETL